METLIDRWECFSNLDTRNSIYILVQYSMILPTAWWQQSDNVCQTFELPKTPLAHPQGWAMRCLLGVLLRFLWVYFTGFNLLNQFDASIRYSISENKCQAIHLLDITFISHLEITPMVKLANGTSVTPNHGLCWQFSNKVNYLTLHMLNFSEETKTYIYILCHSSKLPWHR